MRITASASCFVPKPQTPFQWDAQDTLEQFREKQAHLKVVMKTKNVTYNWHDAETSVLEGVIARGDRRQGKAILLAWQRGCKMDGWDQCFDFDKWMQAFSRLRTRSRVLRISSASDGRGVPVGSHRLRHAQGASQA